MFMMGGDPVGVGAVETYSDQRTNTGRRVALSLLFIFVVAGFGAIYLVGNLAKYQEAISARETQTALRGVNNPEQLDQALKQLPLNNILKLIALANKESIEIDAITQRLLSEAQPKGLSKPIDLGASSRSDLDALRRDLQIAESNAATFEPGYIALIKAERDKVETEARSLKVGNNTITRFMAMIDGQDAEMMTLTSRVLAARAEYYSAYEKCAALLVREFGIYKVENGQFVFPFQHTADSYNRAAAAMAAGAKRIAELEGERATLRQSQLSRWKTLAER
jgi:hypothetical protein